MILRSLSVVNKHFIWNSFQAAGCASADAFSFAIANTLNILRRNGHASITTAQRFLCHDIDKLLALVK